MKRVLATLLFFIFLGTYPGPSHADNGANDPQIEGMRARKNQRYLLYKTNLRGDKRRIFRRYGYTPNRLRVDHGWGEITETWTYHDRGLEFTFNNESELIEKRKIAVEDRSVNYW
jgi:hypothetical protein